LNDENNNGDKTFIRITNRMIYDKIENIEKQISEIKNSVVMKTECATIRKQANFNLRYVVWIFFSIAAIAISVWAALK